MSVQLWSTTLGPCGAKLTTGLVQMLQANYISGAVASVIKTSSKIRSLDITDPAMEFFDIVGIHAKDKNKNNNLFGVVLRLL